MHATTTPSLIGDWNISRARDNASAIESTTLSIREDTAGAPMLDGLSPVAGGPDLVFNGSATPDLRAWAGTVSLPSHQPTSFMFIVSDDGDSLGGWVTEPDSGQTTAWVGRRG